MAELTIANWNIQWMNRWFTADNSGAPAFRPSDEIRGGVTDIGALSARVGRVIDGLAADIITIQEGPSRRAEMTLFVDEILDGAYEVFGPAGKGQQKIYALLRSGSNVITNVRRVEEDLGFDFDDSWEVDIDADLHLDEYGFTRPPLVLTVTTAGGKEFRLLCAHTKSKFVRGGETMWNDPARRQDFVAKAMTVRRRISAEALRIRDYLNTCFAADIEAPIVVTGDLNDGPGLDYFERHFLTQNVASLIAGSAFQPRRALRHAFIDQVEKEKNFTAIFDDFIDEIDDRKLLLDHIFVSANLYFGGVDGARSVEGRIAHDVFDAEVDETAPAGSRQHLPSDHRPQAMRMTV